MSPLENCFISVNTSCSTESSVHCGETIRLAGATIQTVTVVGYATDKMHTKCSAKAGVSTTLTRKYNCDTDSIIFICDGEGSSYESGDTDGLVSIRAPSVTTPSLTMTVLDPVSMCCGNVSITSGYGLSYSGNPISFSTSEDSCTMIDLDLSPVSGIYYLQSFSLNMPSGQIPTASYTLVKVFKE